MKGGELLGTAPSQHLGEGAGRAGMSPGTTADGFLGWEVCTAQPLAQGVPHRGQKSTALPEHKGLLVQPGHKGCPKLWCLQRLAHSTRPDLEEIRDV